MTGLKILENGIRSITLYTSTVVVNMLTLVASI
jgi:hypothetical protein